MNDDAWAEDLAVILEDLLARVRDRALLRYRSDVPIVKAVLGDDGGLIGAAVYLKSTINLQ